MRAVLIGSDGPEVRTVPDPVPGPGDLLVRVQVAGINAGDLLQLRGRYPPPPGWPAEILGIEVAGEVVATGPGPTRFRSGDRIMAVVGGGGQAELAVVRDDEAMAAPASRAWDEAGGFPEAYTTAHDALFTQAGLALGERVLVTGAAGGVGTAAVQLASLAGAQVTASVRDPAHRAAVAALGARTVDPGDRLPPGAFDVVLELVGGAAIDADLASLAVGGRICLIGGAALAAEVDLGGLMARRGRILGSTLRGRPPADRAAAAGLVAARVAPHFGAGRLSVPIDAAFALEDAAAAYDHFAGGGKFGKVILRCS